MDLLRTILVRTILSVGVNHLLLETGERVPSRVRFLAHIHMTLFRFQVLSSASTRPACGSKRIECGSVQKVPGPHSCPCSGIDTGAGTGGRQWRRVRVGMVSPQTRAKTLSTQRACPLFPYFSYLNLSTFHTISNVRLNNFYFFCPL